MYLLSIRAGKVTDTNKVIHSKALDAVQVFKVAFGLDIVDGRTSVGPDPRVVVVEA
jgi:hypothetical protein